MRAIDKAFEPRELTWFRNQGGTWAGLGAREKAAIRQSLLMEQGFICAFCMQRIRASNVKIAHWHCRSRYSDEELDYGNLLACCNGNEGMSKPDQTCDTRQADRDIVFNPADKSHHLRMLVRYIGDGTIESEDSVFDAQLNDVLNLNHYRLKQNRCEVLKAIQIRLSSVPGQRTKIEIQRLITRFEKPDAEGQLAPFCDVANYYLSKKLKRTM